jgi:hypothetical protein
MEINRQNYESFLIDYMDGRLPEHMVGALLVFLKNNPDIDREISSLQDFVYTPEQIIYKEKSLLKKTFLSDIPGLSKFEQLSIGYLENDLSDNQKNELNGLIKNSTQKLLEHHLIQQTRLNPDKNLFYPDKQALKKQTIFSTYYKRVVLYAIAAGILLVAGFSVLLRDDQSFKNGNAFTYSSMKIKQRTIVTPDLHMINSNHYNEIKLSVVQNPMDTVSEKQAENLALLETRQISGIKNPGGKEQIRIADLGIVQNYESISNDGDYTSIQTYLNHKFKEKILKQDKNEKVSLISLINAFGRFTHKVFNKKLEVEKTVTDDGNLLFAIKTDSYNFYTLKDRSDKNREKEEKEKTRQNSPGLNQN